MNMYQGPSQLVLIPDIHSSDQVWTQQIAAFPKAICPAWIAVSPNDSVRDYARRYSQSWIHSANIDWKKPVYLVGFEFGGPIALEAAEWMIEQGVSVASVLLIGSFRDSSRVLRRLRWRAHLSRWLGDVQLRKFLSRRLANSLAQEGVDNAIIQRITQSLQKIDAGLYRALARANLNWRIDAKRSLPVTLQVHQIHGRKDRLIAPPTVDEATILLQGEHFIPLSQSEQVNRWIEAILRDHDLKRDNAV